MKRLKIALVGAGNIMQSRHVPCLITARDRFEIVGVIDPSAPRAQKLAARYAIPHRAQPVLLVA